MPMTVIQLYLKHFEWSQRPGKETERIESKIRDHSDQNTVKAARIIRRVFRDTRKLSVTQPSKTNKE